MFLKHMFRRCCYVFPRKVSLCHAYYMVNGWRFYFNEVISQSSNLDGWISLVIPELFKLNFILVIVSIIGHTLIAAISSKVAQAS